MNRYTVKETPFSVKAAKTRENGYLQIWDERLVILSAMPTNLTNYTMIYKTL